MKKSDIRTFGIIGGDKRQLFLAKSISDSCYDVLLGGFNRLESHGSLSLCSVKKAISESDALIFPLPSIRTDGSLNTGTFCLTVTKLKLSLKSLFSPR